MSAKGYFRHLWGGRRNGPADRLIFAILVPLSFFYKTILRLRSMAYASGLLGSHRLPKPVVSVGNLTVGGTGKTPMVEYLARRLMARGKRVAVLSRGYGGSLEGRTAILSDGESLMLSPTEAGDEPCLLAAGTPGLMVVIGADRYRAGRLAMEKLSPDIFILDDGYQHLRLKRDLNILLLDCRRPFGNGMGLPAGELREPLTAIERADLVVYTRCDGNPPDHPLDKPWCASSHRLTGARPLGGGEPVAVGALASLRIVAFAGIADPSSFFASLEGEGVSPAVTLSFPDHCKYGKREIEELLRAKEELRADCMVTTGKDAVKLKPYLGMLGGVYAIEMELAFADPLPLDTRLEKLL